MICVDACVAAKWVLVEEHSDVALALYLACAGPQGPVVAPPLLPYELANVIRQRMRREGLTLDDATRLFNDFASFPVRLVSPPSLHGDALAIADAYALGAVYDAHYIALAQHRACDFWTDDRRLLRALAGRLPFVRWIGDFQG